MAEGRGVEPHGFPVITVFKTACIPRRETFRFGTGGETRTPKIQLLRLTCYSNYIAPAQGSKCGGKRRS